MNPETASDTTTKIEFSITAIREYLEIYKGEDEIWLFIGTDDRKTIKFYSNETELKTCEDWVIYPIVCEDSLDLAAEDIFDSLNPL